MNQPSLLSENCKLAIEGELGLYEDCLISINQRLVNQSCKYSRQPSKIHGVVYPNLFEGQLKTKIRFEGVLRGFIPLKTI